MPPRTDHNLNLPQGCLVVFVDDTGHEALVPGHSVYGLGGCAVMESDLERVIREPWRELRKRINGSPDKPLHASEFAQSARLEDSQAIAAFFRVQPFARIGSIVSIQSALAPELGPGGVRNVGRCVAICGARLADLVFDSACDLFDE
jgi:hypothetical protein